MYGTTGKYASPVSLPPFKYTTDHLWVEIEGQRYDRHDSTSLYNLLTYVDPEPAYTKAGKLRVRQPKPHVDETQNFYLAQLYHYGLESRDTKQAAKDALLAALRTQGSPLKVPESVRKIEKDLAEKYQVKNVAAEGEYRRAKIRREEAERAKEKKRKREEEQLLAETLGEASWASASAQKKSKSGKPLQKLNIQMLAGAYTITAPQVSEEWNCGELLRLELAPSSTGSHLWGSFDFGPFMGKLRSCTSVMPSNNCTIKFLWRGRETGEGVSTYDAENVAEFQFLQNGKFMGTMYWDCLGEFNLVGIKDEPASRNRELSKKVPKWKEEYWSLTEANYDRECVDRWGGWVSYPDETPEPNSDTESSEKGDGDEDKEDEEDGDEDREDEEDEDEDRNEDEVKVKEESEGEYF